MALALFGSSNSWPPEISDDGKSLTLTYTKPFADWAVDMFMYVPAHITAEKALGLSDPQ